MAGRRENGMKKTEASIQRCKTMSTLQKVLGGKWKLEILYYISFCGINRFGALRRQLGEITESSLTKQLRELEADGFLIRRDFGEVPPHVEYALSDLGRSFMDVISYMKAWGERNLPRDGGEQKALNNWISQDRDTAGQ